MNSTMKVSSTVKKIIAVAALAVGAGLIAGFLAVAGGGDSGAEARERWRQPRMPDAAPSAGAEAILASGHFPEWVDEKEVGEEGGEAEAPGAPKAISVQILNGQLIVSLKLWSGKMRSASVGDEFYGGWLLADATMQAVVWEKDGEQSAQKLFGY